MTRRIAAIVVAAISDTRCFEIVEIKPNARRPSPRAVKKRLRTEYPDAQLIRWNQFEVRP